MMFRNETVFTDAVIDLAKRYGWLVFHVRGNTKRLIQGHAGFPDLVLAKQGRVLFRELKMPRGPFRDGQKAWLTATGGEVWYPADWDQIVETLAGIRF